MKTYRLRFNLGVITLMGLLTISSCKKMLEEVSEYPQNGVASVSVVHAAPATGSLDFAFDKNRPNLNFFNYTDRVNYLNAFAGTRTFAVFRRGTSDTLVRKTISLVPTKNYTIFIVDTLRKMDVVLIRDSSRAPGADSVRIRLVNMSPDAGNLDLYLEGSDAPIATNIAYKTAAEFVSLKAANNVAFEVRQAGQSAVLAKSSVKLNLLNGNYYTVWATGFKGIATDDGKLRVESFWH